MIEAVVRVNDIMGEISSASDEQNRGIEQINIAVAQLDEVTQRNAGLVTESARSAHTMETEVGELSNSIAVLRLAGQGREAVDEPRTTPAAASSAATASAGREACAAAPRHVHHHRPATASHAPRSGQHGTRAASRQASPVEEWIDF